MLQLREAYTDFVGNFWCSGDFFSVHALQIV